MAKIIQSSQIYRLLDYLEKYFLIIAPVEKDGTFKFELINPYYGRPSRVKKVALDYPTTLLPPAKVALLPPKELMIDYDQKPKLGKNNKEAKNEMPLQILFGVHDYDIKAINLLDKVMAKPKPDYYYQKRRSKTIIIGVSHQRTEHHFDHFFPFDIEQGYDLFLVKMEGFYLVLVGSKKGEKIAKLPFFENSTWTIKYTREQTNDIIFSHKTSQLIEKNKESKIWDKLADRCFGCGVCSYVCPLCYCFETFDENNFSGCKKCRFRRWDACFLPDFFRVGGGNNLKPKFRDRSYNWYHHKFVRFPHEYGHPGCVGCGRCIAQCPAKINFRKTLEDLIKESENG